MQARIEIWRKDCGVSSVLVNPLATQVPPKRGLTRRQAQCKRKLAALIAARGYIPTYQEICRVFRVNSQAAVFRMLRILEAKGHLKREKGDRSSLEMIP